MADYLGWCGLSLLNVIASAAGTNMGITAECNAGNDINQIVLVDVLDFSINKHT